MTAAATAGVIATFNQRDYIAEAVSSLAPQVDELVVIDDASTDGTWDVLRSLPFANLILLRNPEQSGVSASYNRAVDAVAAAVLVIQGGDDRSLPDRVSRQASALDDPEVTLVHSLPAVIDGAGRRLPDALAAEFLAGADDPDPLTFLFFTANFICAPSVALRTADYRRHGGFKRGIDLLQDFDMWLALAAQGSFVRLGEAVVEYRKHGTNISREYAAFDGPKQRRLAAEREHVLGSFLDGADRSTLDRLASSSSLDSANLATLDRDELAMLIRLSHPDRLVVRRGLDALFTAVAGASDERLALMGLGPADLGHFATIADVENLADVGRALGSITAAQRAIRPDGAL